MTWRSGGSIGGASISIGGVNIDAETFEWPLVIGSRSPEMRFVVSTAVAERLAKLKNPVTLDVKCSAWSGSEAIECNPTFSDLYLWQFGPAINPWMTWVSLRDRRALWEYLNFTSEHNVIRLTNKQRIPGYAVGAEREFARIAQFRYLPRSVKLQDELRHASAIDGFSGQGKVTTWYAMDIVRWLFEQLPDGLRPLEVIVEAENNKYEVENEVNLQDSWPSLMDRYATLARVGFYMRDGKAVITSLEDAPLPKGLGSYAGGGFLSQADYSRARAPEVIIRSPKLHELRADYVEKNDGPTGTTTREALELVNTAKCPGRVKNPSGGYFENGEEVPLSDLLDAWNKDTDIGWPANLKLDYVTLRRLVLHPHIIPLFTGGALDGFINYQNYVRATRVTAALESYRRRFRLNTVWLDSFRDWRMQEVELADARTGHLPPSTVYCDFTIVPHRGPLPRKRKSPTVIRCRAWDENERKRPLPRLSKAIMSLDGTAAIVPGTGKSLGVFQVVVYPDLQATRDQTILGIVADEPAYDLYDRASPALWGEKTGIEGEWRLAVKFSAILATPPTNLQHYSVTRQAAQHTDEAAGGPVVELWQGKEPLRVAWRDGTSRPTIDQQGYLTIEGGKILNADILDVIGERMAGRYYFQARDRYVGNWSTPYWVDEVCRPRGNVTAVTFFYDRGEFGCRFDAPEPPPAPDLFETLPQSIRAILYPRLAEGGGDA